MIQGATLVMPHTGHSSFMGEHGPERVRPSACPTKQAHIEQTKQAPLRDSLSELVRQSKSMSIPFFHTKVGTRRTSSPTSIVPSERQRKDRAVHGGNLFAPVGDLMVLPLEEARRALKSELGAAADVQYPYVPPQERTDLLDQAITIDVLDTKRDPCPQMLS